MLVTICLNENGKFQYSHFRKEIIPIKNDCPSDLFVVFSDIIWKVKYTNIIRVTILIKELVCYHAIMGKLYYQ